MLIKLNNNTVINTYHIIMVQDNNVIMRDDKVLKVTPDELFTLFQELFPEYDAPKSKGGDLETLLNDLNSLLGGRGNAKMTTDRKARLTTRLKDFSPDELKRAAFNLGSDEFMQGANDNGKRYGTIDYLIRTSANVNKWLEEQPEKKKSLF